MQKLAAKGNEYGTADISSDGGRCPGPQWPLAASAASCDGALLEEPLLVGDHIDESGVTIAAPENLDKFFQRLYSYWREQGLLLLFVSRATACLAFLFYIFLAGALLLYVDWAALSSTAIIKEHEDISKVVFAPPGQHHSPAYIAACFVYLALTCGLLGWRTVDAVTDVRGAMEVRRLLLSPLGIEDREVRSIAWTQLVRRILAGQGVVRLCLARDLTALDVVQGMLRHENYLVGMINLGVLSLAPPLPYLRNRPMMTQTMEWNLRWCLLGPMFDERLRIRPEFAHNPQALQRSLRVAAVTNAAMAPFLAVFLVTRFVFQNLERLYHHPSSLARRSWSPGAWWALRELNELPHQLDHRLARTQRAGERYLSCFRAISAVHFARLFSFILGSGAAALLLMAMVDENLLERPLWGRNLVWWLASLGVGLAICRGAMGPEEQVAAVDPDRALSDMGWYLRHFPRRWHGRARNEEVIGEVRRMLPFTIVLLIQELSSLFTNPLVLGLSLPRCCPAICEFVRNFTCSDDALGETCSLAAFNLAAHGNALFGSPSHAPEGARTNNGKLERSILTFAATYRFWVPPRAVQQMLATAGRARAGPDDVWRANKSTLPDTPPEGPGELHRPAGSGSYGTVSAHDWSVFLRAGMLPATAPEDWKHAVQAELSAMLCNVGTNAMSDSITPLARNMSFEGPQGVDEEHILDASHSIMSKFVNAAMSRDRPVDSWGN